MKCPFSLRFVIPNFQFDDEILFKIGKRSDVLGAGTKLFVTETNKSMYDTCQTRV